MEHSASHSMEDLPEFFSPADLAAVLRISRATAYRMAASGRLPCLRIGKRVLVSKSHLVAWIDRSIQGTK